MGQYLKQNLSILFLQLFYKFEIIQNSFFLPKSLFSLVGVVDRPLPSYLFYVYAQQSCTFIVVHCKFKFKFNSGVVECMIDYRLQEFSLIWTFIWKNQILTNPLIVDVFMPEFTNMNCFKCFVLASVSPFCRKEQRVRANIS